MDWFERITGFREIDYARTRQQLEVADGQLRSTVNGRSFATGHLELVSLQSLRERLVAAGGLPGRGRLSARGGRRPAAPVRQREPVEGAAEDHREDGQMRLGGHPDQPLRHPAVQPR